MHERPMVFFYKVLRLDLYLSVVFMPKNYFLHFSVFWSKNFLFLLNNDYSYSLREVKNKNT